MYSDSEDEANNFYTRQMTANFESGSSTQLTQLTSLMFQLTENVVRMQGNVASSPHHSKFGGESIPVFNPEDRNQNTDMWIKKVEELREVFSWTEPVTIHHATSKFRGLALTWYRGLSSLNHTWEEWKTLLRQSFPTKYDYYGKLEEMMQRVKDPRESMTRYFYEKLALLNACKIYGEDAVSCLIGGIKDFTIQSAARAGGYTTPESLLVFLKAFDNKKMTTHFSSGHKHDFKRRHPSTSKHPYVPPKKPVTCFRCGERGHISTACSKPCTKCHRHHTSRECPPREQAKNVMMTHTQQENEKYFVDAKINDHPTRAYIDLGSSCNTIRYSETKRINLKYNDSSSVTIQGFGSGIVQSIGEATATLKVGDVTVDLQFCVVPDTAQIIPLLIGQPLVNLENIVVIIDDANLRIMHKSDAKIGVLPPTKVTLWAREASVIPSNYLGYVKIISKDHLTGDAYIEGSLRLAPGQETYIPGCVISVSADGTGMLPLANLSHQDILIKTSRPIARGILCTVELEGGRGKKHILTINTTNPPPLPANEIKMGDLTENQKNELIQLLNTYRDCFAQNLSEVGCTKKTEMDIKLTSDQPITYRPYRMAHNEKNIVRDMVQELQANDIIRDSNSPYSAPILLVKKSTGDYRLCMDYRKLNSVTIKDRYPLPRIDDQLDRLRDSRYFTTLDLMSGYYQIPISEQSKYKTAFVTPDGHYEFNRMPFGLTNAPSVFQRMMDTILGPLKNTIALAYIDDVLIPSKTIAEGMKNLQTILELLRKEGLTLKLSKCHFFQQEITYLGFDISNNSVRPSNRKILAVAKFPTPTNVHQARQFLGLTNYFRQFVEKYALIAKPLSTLTKKTQPWRWGSTEQTAFEQLKEKLTCRPVLAIYNHKAATEVHTDASKLGIAGILLQKQNDGKLHPVAYYSRQTNSCEEKYHSYELETLAVVESLKKFRVYLLGIEFKVITDCNAIKTAGTKKDLIPRIARWWLDLQEYTFTVEYRPGQRMNHVDALSRNPVQTENTAAEHNVLHIKTADWVLSGQLTDEKIREIREILTKPANTDYEQTIHDTYTLKNARVYRKTSHGEQWVVPKGMRAQIVRAAHDDMGHFSLQKTLNKLCETYWFPKMREYVQKYITCCIPCIMHKKPSGRKPGLLNPIEKIATPFHTIHIDHLGPFPKSTRGNAHLIVAVDAFTKFVIMAPVKTTTSTPVQKFLQRIFDTYGTPNRIISDRGTAFTSHSFKEFCQKLGIKHILNAVATPRANGQVERYHRTILSSLQTSTKDSKWDDELNKIQFGINNTLNSATGKTPSEVLFGYKPRASSDAIITTEIQEERPSVSDVHKVRETVAQTIRTNQLKGKERYDDKRCQGRTYSRGDLVVIEKQNPSTGTSRKLQPTYAGPMQVERVLPNDRYVIVDLPGSTRSAKSQYSNVVAIDRMKPWVPPGGTSDTSSESDE